MTPDALDKRDEGEPDDLFFLSGGPLAAILLGMGLVPLRGFTVASNFTFVFVVLTIVVAEFGDWRAALATAVTSTLSLDFFLTEPYLELTISSKHDVIAFFGLAICGLLVATLSSRRARNQQALRVARAHLDLLHAGVREMDEASVAKPGIEHLVDALRGVALLAAVAVRDERGRLLASSGDGAARTPPDETLRPEELLVVLPGPRRILPPEGNRISLKMGTRPVGSLDVWSAGPPLSADAGRLLSDLAILLGLLLGHQAAESR